MRKFGLKLCKIIDTISNGMLLVIFLLFLGYGLYGTWDGRHIAFQAQSEVYETYRPKEKDTTSFAELQKINPDVFSWLSVYGTGVDYPVVQGKTNDDYLNLTPKKEYRLSGSIFLDFRNQRDFSDFNSIIFGHHMEESAMFGDIDKFADKAYFDDHLYGNLYYNGKNHGLKFFAALKVDAFDPLYMTPERTIAGQQAYLQKIREKAVQWRDLKITPKDRLVLLSTCSAESTNGRHILVGKITQEEIPIPEKFKQKTNDDFLGKLKASQSSMFSFLLEKDHPLILGLIVFLLIVTLYWYVRKKRIVEEEKNEN